MYSEILKMLPIRCSGKRFKALLFLTCLLANLLFLFYLKSIRTRLNYTEIDLERFFEYIPFYPEAFVPIQWPQNVNIPRIIEQTSTNQSVHDEPINKPNFEFIISNPEKCSHLDRSGQSEDQGFKLLILIKSAAKHFERRQGIRQTWGDEQCWGPLQVVRIFLLGQLLDEGAEVQDQIQSEQSKHQDIVQQNFFDSYYNVTYKTMMGIEWAVTYCPKAQLLMFVDDDFFVHPKKNVQILEQFHRYFDRNFIAGNLLPHSQPNRSPQSKWFIEKTEYPYDYYPPYFHAGHYFVSMHFARQLRIAMWYTKYLRFDDVFLGLVLMKLAYNRATIRSIRVAQQITFFVIRRFSSMHAYQTAEQQISSWQYLNCQSYCRNSTEDGTL